MPVRAVVFGLACDDVAVIVDEVVLHGAGVVLVPAEVAAEFRNVCAEHDGACCPSSVEFCVAVDGELLSLCSFGSCVVVDACFADELDVCIDDEGACSCGSHVG